MQRGIVLFLCFALVAVFVAGLLAIATPSDALEARVALERPLERWRELGGSDDPGTMAPPRVPDAANAAIVYRRAYVELGRLDGADRGLLDLATLRERPEDVAAIAARLDGVVATAREASRRPKCEWTRGYYRRGSLTPADLDEFDRFIRLSVAVAAHAAGRADDGDLDAAVDDLAAVRRMAGHALTHPHAAQAVMGLFIDLAAFEVFERVFRDRVLSDRAALDLAVRRDYRDAMRRTLLIHGAGCLLALDDPEPAGAGVLASWQRDRVKAWFLDVMGDAVAALAAGGRPAPRTTAPPAGFDSAGVFLPAPSLFDAIDAVTIRNDMAAAAVKLRSHRAASGDYPDLWAPDARMTIRYRREGRGFVLSAADRELDWRWD